MLIFIIMLNNIYQEQKSIKTQTNNDDFRVCQSYCTCKINALMQKRLFCFF